MNSITRTVVIAFRQPNDAKNRAIFDAMKLLGNSGFSNGHACRWISSSPRIYDLRNNDRSHSVDIGLIGRHLSTFARNSDQNATGYWLYGFGTAACALAALAYYYGFPKMDLRSVLPTVHAAKLIEEVEQSGKLPKAQLNFIADVVEKISPAVVYIDAVGKLPFFGEASVTSGSGFIVRSDGYVLTNAHVVEGVRGRKLRVHLHDGRTFEGYVSYMDRSGDLALVRINGKDLPAMQLGDSSRARPGEWVIAVGSPFSLTNTVTMGIISSVKRRGSDLGLQNSVDYIQTDALITFGNSGGPLVNLDGEAIGINSMKVTDGISFAIPSDYAKHFLVQCAELEEQAKGRSDSWLFGKKKDQGSELVRPARGKRRIGATLLQLDEESSMALRSHNPSFPNITEGVLVHSVVIGAPAHEAGLLPGDVVTHANGQKVRTSGDLLNIIESSDNIRMRVIRKSNTFEVNVAPMVDDF